MLSLPMLIDRNLPWRAWFKSAGVRLDRDVRGTSFTDTNALLEAAVTGQGVALGRLSVTRSDIVAGKAGSPIRPRFSANFPALRSLSGSVGV